MTRALRQARRAFLAVALFSIVANVLLLTGPLYMLQIYDRVMASGSVPTLVAISLLAMGLYAMLGVFNFLRSRVMSRVGAWLDEHLGEDALRLWIVRHSAAPAGSPILSEQKPLSDLALLRTYIASPAFLALFDLPWFPFYLLILFIFHPYLGYLALAGAALVLMLALLNMHLTGNATVASGLHERNATLFAEQCCRNAEAVMAMGMLENLQRYWRRLHRHALHHGQRASDRSEVISNLTKSSRMFIQSGLLGLGAWLALKGEISPGAIIAGSIIGGRALAPIDQAIAGWMHTLRAHQAYKRLHKLMGLVRDAPQDRAPSLPEPKGHLVVRKVSKLAPDGSLDSDGQPRVILDDVNFTLSPGDGLGVIGPSAAGKTTLARLLTGVWLPDSGTVRLDGATFDQWDMLQLGRHIGYLPQSHELIAGTVAQNIARFDPDAADEDIIAAAQLAGVHEMILRLPDGYATHIGQHGARLSSGQRQRIALARAVFGMPRLVVLDEPNANLDSEGDRALTRTVERLREAGSVVVVMTHRPSAIAAVDLILMLDGGRQVDFGPKTEILRKYTRVAASS